MNLFAKAAETDNRMAWISARNIKYVSQDGDIDRCTVHFTDGTTLSVQTSAERLIRDLATPPR